MARSAAARSEVASTVSKPRRCAARASSWWNGALNRRNPSTVWLSERPAPDAMRPYSAALADAWRSISVAPSPAGASRCWSSHAASISPRARNASRCSSVKVGIQGKSAARTLPARRYVRVIRVVVSPALSSDGRLVRADGSIRCSPDRENRRWPPGVMKTRRRPASPQRRTVAGETPRSRLASERLIQSMTRAVGGGKFYLNLSNYAQ
jgi:hypothetical protein